MCPWAPPPLLAQIVQFLVPAVGVLRETGTLYSYDTEALACWRLHDDPALQTIRDFGAKRLETRDFGAVDTQAQRKS